MKNIKEDERLNVLNHSCAHLLAQAIKHLYPKALFWVGPVIEEGFYYDMDLGDEVITEEDLPRIEQEMKKISKDGKRIYREELTKKEALEKFKNDPYKLDLINNLKEDEVISCYTQGDFTDLCRGPHVDTVKELKYFKLLKVSGAYYKGDSKNKMLQRIYGVCFDNEEDLNEHLNWLEEIKLRDHRKLGKELKIFTIIPEAGQGLVFWLPNGMALKKVLEDYSYEIQKKDGYSFVSTPVLGTRWLYETSGHWDHYKDSMFPVMKAPDGEELVLRPMSCPHHCLIYRSELRSYKDLPIRYSENVIQHRWEATGGLTGLERVRGMNLTDAHLFVRPDQIKEEVSRAYNLIAKAIKDLGIKIDYVELALHDPNNKEKYHNDEELWHKAEDAVRKTLNELDIPYKEAIGEAAFYGPKIDIQVKTLVGKVITFATIQLDFLLPERFDLTYINEEGEKVRPVMIHRGLISTYERLISILLEQYAGAFPLWLAPVQVNIIPVSNDYHAEYAKKIKELLEENNIRTELNLKEDKLGYKMRESQMQKIPYTLVLGDKEIENESVNYRLYNSNEQIELNVNEFVDKLKEEIREKVISIDK
ncbi:MAG TPA: threonine--tRNA ligase [Bacilli bacterium]|nr:threonine--tRNA ligase [Bacilli bacterium]